jgi:nitrate reductase NapAB chaperone NapD
MSQTIDKLADTLDQFYECKILAEETRGKIIKILGDCPDTELYHVLEKLVWVFSEGHK